MRQLSPTFMQNLSNPEGMLYPILQRVKHDNTLMIAIREKYINIYYRGGNLLKISEQVKGNYLTGFDENYGWSVKHLPRLINNQKDCMSWVVEFPFMKSAMDRFFAINKRLEREFQQVVFRENNDSSISDKSDYFITDIECTDTELHAKVDMLAICWPSNSRKDSSKCRPVLIEMKYGDQSLAGEAGILKHLRDFDALISNFEKYKSLLEMMESQFHQLHELGLMNFIESKERKQLRLDLEARPEVVFLLANHTPRDGKLMKILETPEVIVFSQNPRFELRFYVASFAGYGLFPGCMLPLDQFRELLKRAN
jgi:hypothetical protein